MELRFGGLNMPRKKAVVEKPTQMHRFSVLVFASLFSVSFFFQIWWSFGYPVKDIELWTKVLWTLIPFYGGYLFGQNRDTRHDGSFI